MKLFKKTDILIITVIIAAAMVIWLFYSNAVSGRPVRAEIYYWSDLVETVELVPGQQRTITVPQDEDVVLQLDTDGSIRFIRSDCPDKICVKTGRIHLAGQSAACLPNGVIVKIVPADGWKESDPDIVIGSRGK
ncbi:MAG: NusG domain II-containing protein [Clostridiaceae bacterium]|jgi:hypothetical protein|nr:NusG domain II-containing protein [Clostridiaceae bacterium]